MRALLWILAAGCYTGGASPAPTTSAITIGDHRERFVFVSGREAADHWSSPQIFLADPSAQKATNLTNDANPNGSPAISADGQRMAYVSGRSLHVMTLATGDEHEIATGPDAVGAVRWVGDAIAFVAPASTRGSAIWLVTSGDPVRVTDPGPSASDETLATAGRRIVFSRYDEASHDRDLWIVDLDGSNLRRLTRTLDVTETLPAVSHDGRYLAYRAVLSPREELRVVALPAMTPVATVALPEGAYNINGLDFTADDRSLVFGADAPDVGGSLQNVKSELFEAAIDGTHLRRLTKNAAYDGQPAVIP
jgi:Tol biopolymer transport system component